MREVAGTPHRPWSTVLLTLHAVAVTAGAGVLVLGVVSYAGAESRSHEGGGDSWAGLAAVIVGAAGAAVLGVALPLLLLTLAGRQRADRGDGRLLRTLAWAAAGLAVLLLVVAVVSEFGIGPVAVTGDVTPLPVDVVLLVPYLAVAAALIRATGRRPA